MCIKREKKQHMYGVGERNIHPHIKKISTMCVKKKWSQDLKYKNNVSKKERKEKIPVIFIASFISTLSLTKCPILTFPLIMTTLT